MSYIYYSYIKINLAQPDSSERKQEILVDEEIVWKLLQQDTENLELVPFVVEISNAAG